MIERKKEIMNQIHKSFNICFSRWQENMAGTGWVSRWLGQLKHWPPNLMPCIRSPGHMLVGEYQLLTNCLLISMSRLSSEVTHPLDQGSPSLVSVLLFDMGSKVAHTGLELLPHLHPECWGCKHGLPLLPRTPL